MPWAIRSWTIRPQLVCCSYGKHRGTVKNLKQFVFKQYSRLMFYNLNHLFKCSLNLQSGNLVS